MKSPILIPIPRKIVMTGGSLTLGASDCLLISQRDKAVLYNMAKRLQAVAKDHLKLHLPIMVERRGMYRAAVVFEADAALAEEAYTLDIRPDGVRIRFGDGAGAFHAASTLKQLLVQYGKSLPCLSIEDAPDFKRRGIMLDISRNKIPTMASLYQIVDLMADLKLNELQLYIEGFSFAYAAYPWVWQDGTPMTGEEFMELDRYCKERYIDLVPNQNSFGHMGPWLATREFRDLAEKPGGFNGAEVKWDPERHFQAATLNPLDPRSLELVEQITDDLLPYFSSDLFNVGCDETVELGIGKSKELCQQVGGGRVYLDFLLKIYEMAKARGKRIQFWGDIIFRHRDLIPELPKDAIVLEWGYEDRHPFEKRAALLHETGIDFYVCPGTSSWCSLSGRTDNMKANLWSAAVNGKKFRAVGYLNTDWGDEGHWHYQYVSYPGFVYGAAVCWAVEPNEHADIAAYLDRFVFQDENGRMGQLVMDLGNYYLKEKKRQFNGTNVGMSYIYDLDKVQMLDGFTPDDFDEIEEYVRSLEEQLGHVRMRCEDAELLEEEFRNTVRFIVHGCHLCKLKLLLRDGADRESVARLAESMIREITVLTRKHENLWLARNRHGGLNRSVGYLWKMKAFYESLLGQASNP